MTDLTAAPVRAELSAKSVLSYAMANIRIPVIDRLSLISAVDAQGARLRLAVHDEQGPVTQPFERLVDLVAGERTVLDTVGLVADPATMLQIEEQRPASIVVEVEHDGRHLATAREPIRLLAARQWLRVPELLSLEVLASFVMPHDPAVAGLLDEAAAILLQRTGSSSMQGYQAGPERVDAQVQAIFEAMQARGIRYGSAPASWADIGQKIRTPTEVLTGRTGTCLDTVVVMAAILEQTNIRPLLWVVDGHAFLGYWRQESALDAIAQADVSDVVNLVDLDLIRLVETTMVTQPPSEADFAGSSRPPYLGFLTGDLDQVLGVTDVWTARRNGIIPLPARRSTDDGQVVVVEYKAGEHSTVQASRAERDPAVQGASGTAVPARVQQWKNALLDLSLRNRLINYSDRYSVVLHVPDGHLGAVEDLLHEGRALHLLPSDQFDEVHLARGSTQGRDLPHPN